MPHIQWEWKIGFQTVISGLMLATMLGGFMKFFWDFEADMRVAQTQLMTVQSQANRLEIAIAALIQAQIATTGDLAATKAKVDIILPTVQRIEDRLLRTEDHR